MQKFIHPTSLAILWIGHKKRCLLYLQHQNQLNHEEKSLTSTMLSSQQNSVIQVRQFFGKIFQDFDKQDYASIYYNENFKKFDSKIKLSQVDKNILYKIQKNIKQFKFYLEQNEVSQSLIQKFIQILANPTQLSSQYREEGFGDHCSGPLQIFFLFEADHQKYSQAKPEGQEQIQLEKKLQNDTKKYLKQHGQPNLASTAEDSDYQESQYDQNENQQMTKVQLINLSQEKILNLEIKLKKYLWVRYTPQAITHQNMENYFIKDNFLHNFVVRLFALADVMVIGSKQCIQRKENSLHKFLQFNLRYQVYRNFLLQIQEQFAFIFKLYEQMFPRFLDEFERKKLQTPKIKYNSIYYFWRPAMTKWVNQMEKYHSQFTNGPFKRCFNMVRLQAYRQIIINMDQKQGDSTIKGHMLANVREEIEKLKNIRNDIPQEQQIQYYIDYQEDIYSTNNNQYLCQSYINYLLDLEVKSYNIFWFGHRQIQLGQLYESFQKDFLNQNQQFYQTFLENIAYMGKDIQIKTLLRRELQFLSNNVLIIPKTMVKVLKVAQQLIKIDYKDKFIDKQERKMNYVNRFRNKQKNEDIDLNQSIYLKKTPQEIYQFINGI